MIYKNKKKFSLYTKLLGFLTKRGKKSKAKKILNLSFFRISLMFRKPLKHILHGLFRSLNTSIETRTIKIKRSRFVVPFPINLHRRIFLTLKWFTCGIKENTKREPFHIKLVKELVLILTKKDSKVLALKKLNTNKSLTNRSNAHYRW